MSDVFISYSSKDANRVALIVEELERANFNVFWDAFIDSGEAFDDRLERELREARCVVYVITSNSNKPSRWIREELYLALELKKLVLLRVDDVSPPFGLKTIQSNSLFDWDGYRKSSDWKAFVDELSLLVRREDVEIPDVVDRDFSSLYMAIASCMLIALGMALVSTSSIASSSFMYGTGALSLGIINIFQFVEPIMPIHWKHRIRLWLIGEKDGLIGEIPLSVVSMRNLFNILFDFRHFSFKCIARSFFVFSISFIGFFSALELQYGDYFLEHSFYSSLRVLIYLTPNIFVCYVSLFFVRQALRLKSYGAILLTALLLSIVSIALSFLVFGLSATILISTTIGFSDEPRFLGLFGALAALSEIYILMWREYFGQSLSNREVRTGYSILMTSSLAVFWLWLIVFTHPMFQFLNKSRILKLEWVQIFFNVHEHPIKSLGGVCAVVVIFIGVFAWASANILNAI